MSAEVILIIVGAGLLLLAILDSIKIKGKSLGLVNNMLKIILGMTGVLLIIYGGFYFSLVNPQAQIEQVEVEEQLEITGPVDEVLVISPIEGDSVKCRILTMGAYPEDHEEDIWVVLRPSDDRYYPQSDHTNTSFKRNGEWQVITRFGGDKGEAYDVIVYETDAAASDFFTKTIQEWKDALEYPGLELEELPAGAVEVDRITVYLADNCRGVF